MMRFRIQRRRKGKKEKKRTISLLVKSKRIPSPNSHQLLLPPRKTPLHHISNAMRLRRAPHHRVEPRPRRRVEQIFTQRREVRAGIDVSDGSGSSAIIASGLVEFPVAVGAPEHEGSV